MNVSVSEQDGAGYEPLLIQKNNNKEIKYKKGKYVRGRIIVQATMLTPIDDNSCEVLWISCVDPGGLFTSSMSAICRSVIGCVTGSLPNAKKTTAEKGAESVIAMQKAACG